MANPISPRSGGSISKMSREMESFKSRMKIQFHDVIESFYIETLDGFFFAVKGLEHPAERLIAVLRYVPDSVKGDRKKERTFYRRLYGFGEQESFIRKACPQCLIYDPVFRTKLQSVPRSSVRRIYDPRLRLQELLQASDGTEIEQDAVAFALLLQAESEIAQPGLGITGSLLIGLHTEKSDLDIAVFGKNNGIKLFQALKQLLDSGSYSDLCRLDTAGIKELYAQRVADTHMGFEDFVRLEMRKANQGRFRERMYFIRFVPEMHEAADVYGGRSYTPIGRASISASISDDRESIFTPCRYGVSGVRSMDGSDLPEIKEIVSFRGRFCEQARAGECIIAEGTLECVQTSHGHSWHRLLLGNQPEDTMILQNQIS